MTLNDLQQRIKNDSTIFGVAGYCANCGFNLMCAPASSITYNGMRTWKDRFGKCRACNTRKPPINIHTFTIEAWQDGSWDKEK